MKAKIGKRLLCGLLTLASVGLVGCGDGEKGVDTYTIQYSDGTNIHTLTVKYGDTYSFEGIPEKYGYEFLGWFDMEQGGMQYVNANGMCISPYMTDGNVVLYPRFQPKEFTLIFDYQGAAVSGSRSMTVAYDSTLYGFPTNLTLANQTFLGWYTEPDEQGTQIADAYGVLPALKVNENLFDLSDQDGKIYLYAGFKGVEYPVALHFSANLTEEILVEHGTNIKDILYDTRLNGQGVVAWSTQPNDQDKSHVVSGKITSGMELYPAEYAPMIDFDENGGKQLPPLVARAGENITLPTPEKANYRFLEWQDQSGTARNFTIMPETGLTLKAVYAPIILFDSNGGTQVQEISERVGTDITLPTPEREGFIFAGWYTEGGEKYENTIMPSISMKLTAKYYKIETKIIVLLDASSNEGGAYPPEAPNMKELCNVLDLTDLFEKGVKDIEMTIHYQAKVRLNNTRVHIAAYSEKTASEAYKIWDLMNYHMIDSGWADITATKKVNLIQPKMYICRWSTRSQGDNFATWWRDFWVEIRYGDLTKLY